MLKLKLRITGPHKYFRSRLWRNLFDKWWSAWSRFNMDIFPSVLERCLLLTHFAVTHCTTSINLAYLSMNICCWNVSCCQKLNHWLYFTVNGLINYFKHFKMNLYIAHCNKTNLNDITWLASHVGSWYTCVF